MTAVLVPVSIEDVSKAASDLAERWRPRVTAGELTSVYGVPCGGLTPAALVAGFLGLPVTSAPRGMTLVVDDLVDSGHTARQYDGCMFDALYRKPTSPEWAAPLAVELEGWLTFPWEPDAGPRDSVVELLMHVGEDPRREGLIDTPDRVLRALTEMTSGYTDDPAAILSTVFDEEHDQMVVLSGIEFTSLCEHHLLPFVGVAAVGYVPRSRVVGLSKLARLVECFARRLQVQERMTDQIAGALMDHLAPEGAGVVLRAHHSCMGCRGVRKPSAVMTTSALHGLMRYSADARAEFMALARD